MDLDLRGLKDAVEAMGQHVLDYKAKAEERMNSLEKAVARALSGGVFTGGDSQPAGPYKSLGEQLLDVVAVAKPGGSPAARDKLLKVSAAATGMNEGVPSDGGFLVQEDFSTALIQRSVAKSILQPLCTNVPIGVNSNGVKLPMVDETSRASGSRWGGITTYWTGEGGALTGSKPKLREVAVDLKKLTGLCYASEELMQDAQVLGAVVGGGFASEIAFKKDDSIIRGTGAGQPLGILNAGCLVSVAKETGQANDTILWENIVKMWARLLPSSEANARWLVNKDILPQLYTMNLAVGTGGIPVFMPANGAAGLPYNTLMGKPIQVMEQCATLGDVGDIILADLSEYVWIEKALRQDVSMHVQFIYDESTFRFILRCDGMPVRNSVLTPYKGSATLSPFITLAAR